MFAGIAQALERLRCKLLRRITLQFEHHIIYLSSDAGTIPGLVDDHGGLFGGSVVETGWSLCLSTGRILAFTVK